MISDSLKQVMSEAFILYFKSHSFHWNIEGPDFVQYHKFLGDFYEEVFDSIDVYAELIRTTDQYAPVSLSRLLNLSQIQESTSIPEPVDMLRVIRADNIRFLETLTNVYLEAEKVNEYGISNYLQDRIQAHEKHSWMLKALTK